MDGQNGVEFSPSNKPFIVRERCISTCSQGIGGEEQCCKVIAPIKDGKKIVGGFGREAGHSENGNRSRTCNKPCTVCRVSICRGTQSVRGKNCAVGIYGADSCGAVAGSRRGDC